MEYSTLYNILYKTLCNALPKVIIDYIVFKYIVNSCTYEYKYSISCTKYFSNVHLNKQLGIISFESNKSFKFIDYHSGKEHDGSIIDTMSCNIDYNDAIILFDNDIILTRNAFIHKYILSNKQYVKIPCNYIRTSNQIRIHESLMYMLYKNETHYNIIVYNLEHLNIIYDSHKHEHHEGTLQISIYNDCIYVYECDHINKETRMYIHNINTFHRTIHPHSYLYATLYQNKLYHYKSDKIFVHDANTFEQIYSFDVNQCRKNLHYHVNISDDIMLLSNDEHMVFYQIKN